MNKQLCKNLVVNKREEQLKATERDMDFFQRGFSAGLTYSKEKFSLKEKEGKKC